MKILWLASLTLASTLSAQAVPPGTRFALTPESRLQLDSMAHASIAHHAEQAACVTVSAMRDSLYIIVEIQPAKNIVQADSVAVRVAGPMCESWQPIIHSHILDNGYLTTPSALDYRSTAQRGVFAFLMSVEADTTWSLRAFP